MHTGSRGGASSGAAAGGAGAAAAAAGAVPLGPDGKPAVGQEAVKKFFSVLLNSKGGKGTSKDQVDAIRWACFCLLARVELMNNPL